MKETPNPTSDISPEVSDAIETHAYRLVEHIQYQLHNNLITNLDEFHDELSSLLCLDGTEVLGLSLDEQLGLVEDYANEFGLQLDNMDIDSLRLQIDSLSAQVVAHLGEEHARELLLDLEHYMNRHDLDLQHLTLGNHLSVVAHQGERTEPDGSTVYEYRGIDGMNIDVYELRLGGSMPLFFQKLVTTL